MNAAIYLRVSTNRCKCGHSPTAHAPARVTYLVPTLSCSRCNCAKYEPDQDESNQEPECRRLCTARGWLDPVVVRECESGAKYRPEWRGLVERVRKGEIRAVVFWAVDRIGRNKVQAAHDLRELSRFGAQLVSVQDAWLDQPEGPTRSLMVDIMAWVAEGERARLIERTKAGMRRARNEGKEIGRPRVALDLDRARALLGEGRSYAGVARLLGCSRATLVKVLPGVPKRGPWGRALKGSETRGQSD